MNKKIKVLFIDDNPEGDYFTSLNKLGVIKDYVNDNTVNEIPWVSNEKSYRDVKGKLYNAHELFELRWLQFPEDVFEYRNLSYEIKMKWGIKKLSEVGFIPDIIVFDYALTETGFNMNMALEKSANLNNFINPTRCLASFIKKEENRDVLLKRDKGYSKILPQNNIAHGGDSFGLFCGGLITEMFKYDIPIAAIPTTRFTRTMIENEPYPIFFEWILDDSYNRIFKDREIRRTDKDWNSILTDGLRVYREQIKEMVKIGKITVDLENLLSLLDGDFLEDADGNRTNSYFIFSSEYGKREIPLDGLFIDQEIKVRDSEIKKFINDIIDIIVSAANLGNEIGLKEIKQAKDKAETLWGIYKNKFEDRYLLSDFSYRTEKDIPLTPMEKEKYNALVNQPEFQLNSDGKINNEKSILEYRDEPTAILRLTILYLVSKAEIQLSKLYNKHTRSNYQKLTDEEVYYILNPISGEVILPIHHGKMGISKIAESMCTALARKFFPEDKDKEKRKQIRRPEDFFSFTWISKGEQIILRSFFNEEKSVLPDWLKTK